LDTSKFYPMTEWPTPDESDKSFSKTVIIYGDKPDVVELGFYDFEQGQWSHFGNHSFLLKCWCYIPDPGTIRQSEDWVATEHRGYNRMYQ
jgi:hypothetical protein